MKLFFKILLVLFFLFLFILSSCVSYANFISENICNNVFRLHIIANSNSDKDQNLKYLVREEILTYLNSISKNSSYKDDVINLVDKNISTINSIAQNVVNRNGFDYAVSVEIGNFYFPNKSYGDISLPSGYYDGLQIKIGESSGENWWCVLFPPLCFIDVSTGIVPDDSKELLKKELSAEEYKLISENSTEINFKFKLIEFFQNLNTRTAKK